MHDDMIRIGSILRTARETKGMTQAALAAATDTVDRTIMDIENDKRYPTLEVLYRIVRVLDFPSDHIFWPEKVPMSQELEQLVRAIQSCSKQDQAVVVETAWACIRALQREKGAKKADDL
jgi:DNA-binding XRE family transcriptional regulator